MNSDVSTEKYEPFIIEKPNHIKLKENSLAQIGLEDFEQFAQIINNLSYDLGMVLDEYNSLLSEVLLGNGSFATVYKAINLQNDNLCAIKYFKSENQYNLLQIVSEFNIQYQLNKLNQDKYLLVRPPIQLIQTYPTYLWNVAAELELGEYTLIQYIQSEQQITQSEYMGIFFQILDSILSMHEHNYAHRDIKPQNIIYVKQKGWLLSDFGCSLKYELNEDQYDIAGTKAFNYEEIRKQIKQLYGQQQKALINLFKNDLYAFCLTMAMVKYPDKTVLECQSIIENQLIEVPELNKIMTELNNKELPLIVKLLIPLQYEIIHPYIKVIEKSNLNIIDSFQLKLLKFNAYIKVGKLLDINEYEQIQEQASTIFQKQQIHMMYYIQGLVKEQIPPSQIVIPDRLNKSEGEILHHYLSYIGSYSKLLEILPKFQSTTLNIILFKSWYYIQLNNYEQASEILNSIQLNSNQCTLIDLVFYYAIKEIIILYTKEDFLLDMNNFTIFLTRFGSDTSEFCQMLTFQFLQISIFKGLNLDFQLKLLDQFLKDCNIQSQINQIYYLKTKCYYQLQNIEETQSNISILMKFLNPLNKQAKEILMELIQGEVDKIVIERVLFQIADSYFMLQQYPKSCEYWQELIDYCTQYSNMNLINYFYNYGQCLLCLDRYDEALIAFKTASYSKIKNCYDQSKISIAIAQTQLKLGLTKQSINEIIIIINQLVIEKRNVRGFMEHFQQLSNYCYLLSQYQLLKQAKGIFEKLDEIVQIIPSAYKMEKDKCTFLLIGSQIYFQLQDYQNFKFLQERILQTQESQQSSQITYIEIGSTLLNLAQVNQEIESEQTEANTNKIINYYQQFLDLYIMNQPLSPKIIEVYLELINFCQDKHLIQLESIVESYVAYMVENYGVENQHTLAALKLLEAQNIIQI